MTAARKITVSLPADQLDRALALTKKGVTATLVEALDALEQRERVSALRAMRGKVRVTVELEKLRPR